MLLQPIISLIPKTEASSNQETEVRPPKEGKIELEDKRTEKTKTYLKSDGTKELEISQEPIHFKAGEKNGKPVYDEIKVEIQETSVLNKITGKGSLKNKKNDFNASISKDLSKESLSIKRKGGSASLNLKNISSSQNKNIGFSKERLKKIKPEKKDNSVSYKSVVKDTDITYYSVPSGIKEYILYKNYNGQNIFTFDLNVSNAYFEKQNDGGYKFFNSKTKEEIFSMPRFFMWDSKGGKDSEENAYTFDVLSEIKKNGEKYELIITADDKWLSSKDRVFPVVLDPTISTYSAGDTYVQSGYPDSRWLAYNQANIFVGRGATKGVMYGLIEFPVPDLKGARITGARMDVYQYGNCGGSCTWSGVSAYTTGPYDTGTVVWNNKPNFVWKVGSGWQPNVEGWIGFDVTRALQHWYQEGNYTGSKVNALGFAQDDSTNWGFRTWISRDNVERPWGQPKLTVNYIDYNATYNSLNIPNMAAGTFVDVPIKVTNTGRNWWYKDSPNAFKLSYHWLNSAGQVVLRDGLRTDLPINVAPNGGYVNMIGKVAVPPNPGSYILKWDMVHEGVTWFSDQGVSGFSQNVTVSTPSFSSMVHQGEKDSYTMAGPVDLSNGNLTFSSNDLSVPSKGSGLKFDRTYNSKENFSTYNHDTNGYIRKWLVNGPYKQDNQSFRLSKAGISNEGSVMPSRYSHSNGNLWMEVTEPNTPQMWFNWAFHSLGTNQLDTITNSFAYAHTYVYSPDDRSALLKLGSDDGIEAWVNGEVVIYKDVYRGITLDSDIIAVNLKKGWNSLTTKVSQGVGGWQMSARFTTFNHLIMNDLKYSVVNPFVFDSEGLMSKGWTTTLDDRLLLSGHNNLYTNNFTSTFDGFEFKGVVGTWQTQNGKHIQSNTSQSQKWTSSKKTFGGRYVYEFDYRITSDPYNRKHAGALIDWQYGSVNGYRITHLDGEWWASKWVNGYETIVARVPDLGINPATANVRLKIIRPANGGNTEVLANGIKVMTFSDQTFRGGGVGFHSWGSVVEYDNVKVTTDPEDVYYRDPSGNINVYARAFSDANGSTYHTPPGVTAQLIKNIDGTFSLKEKDGEVTGYGDDGKIAYVSDTAGNKTNFSYNDGKVNKLCDSDSIVLNQTYFGRCIEVSYNSEGKISSVKNAAGLSVNYEYLNGRLSKVKDNYEKAYSYSYNPAGQLALFTDKKENPITIEYNPNGKAIKITDPLQNVTRYSYIWPRTEVVDALGRKSVFNFNSANLLSSYVNAKGYSEKYDYDSRYNITAIYPDILGANDQYYYRADYRYDLKNNLLEVTYPDGSKSAYTYNTNNDLIDSTDQKGQRTSYIYSIDGKRLLLSVRQNDNSLTTYTYNNFGKITSVRDPKGNVTKYEYNPYGDLTSEISPKGEVSKYEHNEVGKVVKSISVLGKAVDISYDSMLRPIALKDPIGNISYGAYDENGNVIKLTDARGNSKQFVYDSLNRTVKVIDELGAETRFEYDAVGNKTKIINAKGKITTLAYDELDQLKSQTDPYGNVINLAYDRNGNIVTSNDPSGNTSQKTYNKMGNLVRINDPEGSKNFTYDKNSSITTQNISANLNKLLYRNDFSGSRQDSFSPISGKWSVENGELVQSESSTLINAYNKSKINGLNFSDGVIDLKVKRTSQTAPYFRFSYRSNGTDNYYVGYIGSVWRIGASVNGVEEFHQVPGVMNQNQTYNIRIEANGENTKLFVNGTKVDEFNFTKGFKEGFLQPMTYQTAATFDDIVVTSSKETVSVNYDSINRPVQIATNTNGVAKDVLDIAGNVTQSVSQTNTVNYGYDSNGQVVSVSNVQNKDGIVLATGQITRDQEGKITSINKANGDVTTFSYDENSRVTTSVTTNKIGEILASYTYEYDPNSNVTKSINNIDGSFKNFTYDERNQLISDDKGNYEYDASGNRTKMVTEKGITNYTYDSLGDGNRLIKSEFIGNDANGNDSVSYTYDKNGNVTSETSTRNGKTAYDYDTSNRMKKAILPNGKVVEYVYDSASGRRVQRIETDPSGNKKYTNFAYDEDKLISESELNGNLIRTYTWDENESLISISLYNPDGTPRTYQYIKDQHGNILGMSDKDGNKVVSYEYDSWGNVLKSEVLSTAEPTDLDKQNPRLYSSYWYDQVLDQYFMKVRMYDPETGRFFSHDPIIASDFPLDMNPYIYTTNNPISMVDPSGKIAFGVIALPFLGAITAPAWLAPVAIGAAIIGVAALVGYGIGKAVNHSKSKTISTPNTSPSPGPSNSGPGRPNGPKNNPIKDAINKVKTGGSKAVNTVKEVVKPVYTYLAPTAPAVPGALSEGKSSFRAIKKVIGDAGKGFEWHHLVEQSQIHRSGFASQAIQNPNNLVRIPSSVHRQISGYYSSIPTSGFTNGMKIRDWLSGQSFEAQYKFGVDVTKRYGLK